MGSLTTGAVVAGRFSVHSWPGLGHWAQGNRAGENGKSQLTSTDQIYYTELQGICFVGVNQSNMTAEYYNNRGLVCADRQDYQRAIANFSKAIELNPQFFEAYYNRGVAYADQENFDEAIANYNQVIELNPQFAQAYNARGIAYSLRGDFEKALPDFSKMIEFNPQSAQAYCHRGIAYYQLGLIAYELPNLFRAKNYFEKATNDYEAAIELNPKFAEAYYYLSVIWLQCEDWDRAESYLTLAQDNDFNIVCAFLKSYEGSREVAVKACAELGYPPHITEMLTGGFA